MVLPDQPKSDSVDSYLHYLYTHIASWLQSPILQSQIGLGLLLLKALLFAYQAEPLAETAALDDDPYLAGLYISAVDELEGQPADFSSARASSMANRLFM